MDKSELEHRIDQLEAKIKKLIENHIHTRQSLEEALNENEVLKKQLDIKNEEIKKFQNQTKVNRIAGSVEDKNFTSGELKGKINEYIKEIDKCIAFLNQS